MCTLKVKLLRLKQQNVLKNSCGASFHWEIFYTLRIKYYKKIPEIIKFILYCSVEIKAQYLILHFFLLTPHHHKCHKYTHIHIHTLPFKMNVIVPFHISRLSSFYFSLLFQSLPFHILFLPSILENFVVSRDEKVFFLFFLCIWS